MKKITALLLTGIAIVGVTVVVRNNLTDSQHLQTARASENELPMCPIMGEPINLAVSTPTDDGPVYFCCKGCIKKYNANPEKYAVDMAKQRKALAKLPKIQVKCPVTGEPTDPKVYTEHNGQKVSFCCKGCMSKYTADANKYKANLANSYTFQTRCPVMDEEITPKAFAELPSGETIYYCCKGCDKKMMANPAKYLAKLQEQGYSYGLDKFKKAADQDDHKGHDHSGHDHGGHDHGG